MDRKFEKWIKEQNNIPKNAISCFYESISCYRANCFRSAIIMAISGFNMVLQNRILIEKDNILYEVKNNNEISEDIKEIEKLIIDSKLTDENQWDLFLVNNLLIKTRFIYIFSLSNNSKIFEDWVYWRNKRNISAHAKDYNIIFSDVESCYSWILQTLKILYPITNINSILTKIDNFFDYFITDISKDINNLCILIETESKKDNLKKINDKLFEILESKKLKNNDKRIYEIISFLLSKSKNKETYINFFADIIINSNKITFQSIKLFADNKNILHNLEDNIKYQFLNNLIENIGYYIYIKEKDYYMDEITDDIDFSIINELVDFLVKIFDYIESGLLTNLYNSRHLFCLFIEIIKRDDSILSKIDNKYFNDINLEYYLRYKGIVHFLNSLIKFEKINLDKLREKLINYMYNNRNIVFNSMKELEKYRYIYGIISEGISNIIKNKIYGYIDYNELGDLLSWIDFSNLSKEDLKFFINAYKNKSSLYKYNSIFFSFKIEYLEKYKSKYPDLEYDINYMIEKYNEFAKINSKYLSE